MRLSSKEDIYTTIQKQETQNVTAKVIEYLGIQFPIDLKIDSTYLFIESKKKSFVVSSPHLDSTGTLKFDYVKEKTKINKYLRRKFVFSRNWLNFKDDRKNYLEFTLEVTPTVNLCNNLPQLQLLTKQLYRSKKNGFRIFETVCNTLNISREDIVSLEIPHLISYSKQQLNCVFEEHKSFSVLYQYGNLTYITDNARVELFPNNNILSVELNDTPDVLESFSLSSLFTKAYRRTAALVEKVAEFNG